MPHIFLAFNDYTAGLLALGGGSNIDHGKRWIRWLRRRESSLTIGETGPLFIR